jgi:hypothetical protein
MLITFYTKTPDGQAGQSDQAKRWFDEFELTGPQNVRAQLAQTNAGSGGSVAIGALQMAIGFAQEWLGLARSPESRRRCRSP